MGVSGLPNPKFWLFPSQLVGPNGFRELAGGVRVSKLIENHAFMRVFCVSVPSTERCVFSCFFEHVPKPIRFRVFLEPRGYGSVPAFPSFSVARSSKTASETNFGHILSHAWPKNFDFVASEAIRSHFPSPIQPYMVRKYSFRGFRNSFGHFQWPIPRLIFGICWALAQKCLC